MICMLTLMIVIGICCNDKDWICTNTMNRMIIKVSLKKQDINIIAIIEHKDSVIPIGADVISWFYSFEYCKYFIYTVNKK
jgi:hypothetical protein